MKNFLAKIKDPRVLRTGLVIIVAVLLIGGYIFYQLLRDRVSIEDSLVQAPIITISPDVPGAITSINVHEGETVKKGDTLAIVGTASLNAYQDGLVVSTDNKLGSIASAATPVVQMINFADMRIAGTIDENKGLESKNRTNRFLYGRCVTGTNFLGICRRNQSDCQADGTAILRFQ